MTSVSSDTTGRPSRAEEELPALYLAQGWRVPLSVMSACLFVAALAAERAPVMLSLGWLTAVALALWLRWSVLKAMVRASHRPILQRMNTIAATVFVGGVVHGQSVLLWPFMDDVGRVAQSVFVLGMCSGTVATLFGYVRVYVAYIVPMLVPLAWAWAQAMTPAGGVWYLGTSGVMVALIAMAGGMMTVLARDNFRLFRQSFESRRSLRAALEQAQDASRAKTRFLASASHDLRQPMHTLSLFVAALAMRPLDAATHNIALQINQAMQALSSQLDALLDISKLDAGVVPVKASDFALDAMLDRLRGEFAPLAQRKGLAFEVQVPAGSVAHTDAQLLERIVRNLLDNAIKYTRAGHISLSAVRHAAVFELSVRDTGIGIPPAEHERVFDEFYQLGNAERDRTQGLGLGLSIVRRLSELLQLGLRMASAAGQGTQFTLMLPAGKQDLKPATAPAASSAWQSIRGLRVLVIDDEEAVREGMRSLLEGLGAEVHVAATTADAEATARQVALDLLLVDFRLRGDDDGLSAVSRLRTLQPAVAALLVSGDTAPERLREAHDAGLRLLHKPVGVELLTRSMREEVDRFEKTKIQGGSP